MYIYAEVAAGGSFKSAAEALRVTVPPPPTCSNEPPPLAQQLQPYDGPWKGGARSKSTTTFQFCFSNIFGFDSKTSLFKFFVRGWRLPFRQCKTKTNGLSTVFHMLPHLPMSQQSQSHFFTSMEEDTSLLPLSRRLLAALLHLLSHHGQKRMTPTSLLLLLICSSSSS